MENYVAQCLGAALGNAGIAKPLWYWTGKSKKGTDGGVNYEVDFLMESPSHDSESDCMIPIEAKAGKDYGKASLTEYRRRYAPTKRCGKTLVLAPKKPGWEGSHLRLPLYYTMYLYGAFAQLSR